ncbi:hypothetical protein DN396_28755 [Bacillus sp. BF9-10]|nr:hypothetical protein DN396_28755 [Bacillus sp. BF9-10]
MKKVCCFNCIRSFNYRITSSYIARENQWINWIEVFVYPIGLILCMILGHFRLPEFSILVGLVCIV